MMRWLPVRWALPILALVFTAVPATAQTEQPFRGEGTFTALGAQVGNCFDMARFSGSGQAALLGSFQGDVHQRVDYCGIYADIGGELIFTAANGDQLTVHYVGVRLDPVTYLAAMAATSGTGQYKGATVDAFLLIENYSLNAPVDFTFSGTISFP